MLSSSWTINSPSLHAFSSYLSNHHVLFINTKIMKLFSATTALLLLINVVTARTINDLEEIYKMISIENSILHEGVGNVYRLHDILTKLNPSI